MTRGVRSVIRERLAAARADGRRPVLSGMDLRGKDLRDLDFSDVVLDSCRLDGANLHAAQMPRTHWMRCSAVGTNLSSALLDGASLIRCDLADADLRRAEFSGASLDDTSLLGADLTDAYLDGLTHRGVRSLITVTGATPWPLTVYPAPTGWRILALDAGNSHPLDTAPSGLAALRHVTGTKTREDELALVSVAAMLDTWTHTRRDALAAVRAAWPDRS